MIARYTLPEMGRIWSEDNKLAIWLQVEILACEAQAELGVVPRAALATIKAKAAYSPSRVLEIENTVKHDVIAFLTNVAENVGPEGRYLHLGMTSSDLLDTALAVQLKQAGELLLRRLQDLRAAIGAQAVAHKYTVCIGRSHGVHAEPTTFGLKLAGWYDEVGRQQQRLQQAVQAVAVGKISGAVGTYAHLDPRVEAHVCDRLGLRPAAISTQIVSRDLHAEFLNTLALIGASLEKFATEIRNLQRTEILEAEEPFASGQKGSSAMPHKRNPITCERITGLARLLRSHALAGMENVALWHERDISHSSVERVVLPDSTIVLDYMLAQFTKVVAGLHVYPENMRRNLARTRGLIHSQQVLLALTRKGMAREEAYRLVQQHAMAIWNAALTATAPAADFQARLLADEQVRRHLSEQEVAQCFELDHNFRHLEAIFARLGLS
ncbi:MAG: adenylosuccinate lyase [candidate division KSB1 bacterium]|nr:adenylosuccinate lyase [candidate division KSB1 bacterium]MDZ7275067.1 adenylosuccinate lyase [candidate division KSB1 bacterium]MDZ7286485.1 adenylosuccinate lyase [candidate division KSB1 bacterium]MDZ7299351.1 adenylosuccinate lyase [candidate division KSB1 bacterium]MDZ7306320.1 adenylosuccinate lyase [candidate division KSB1 bacterium]